MTDTTMHVLMLGAGVQSSMLALKAAAGEVTPMPVAAIFADTRHEPRSVYEWLDWLETQLSFPVYRVSQGDLAADGLEKRVSGKSGKRYLNIKIPFFVANADGSHGIIQRKCTRDYKISPAKRKLREMAGTGKRGVYQHVTQWMGISLDEIQRMNVSMDDWIALRYPLIEMRITRQDCLRWMQERGYPQPPRSACYFCPYHSPHEWLRLKTQEPEEFARAVEYEKVTQEAVRDHSDALQGVPYLVKGGAPLAEVDFEALINGGSREQLSFLDACEGMCGV